MSSFKSTITVLGTRFLPAVLHHLTCFQFSTSALLETVMYIYIGPIYLFLLESWTYMFFANETVSQDDYSGGLGSELDKVELYFTP
jgi:hypothetical protein